MKDSPTKSINNSWEFDFPFNRGRQDFREGRPCPPKPPKNGSVYKPEHARWYGWMHEQGLNKLVRSKIREWAEEGGDLPPSVA